jgi:putative transposase
MARRALHEISPDQWQIAEQRLAAIRRLVAIPKLTREIVEAEARLLGVTYPVVYELLKRYRADPSVEAMLPRKRGTKPGVSHLSIEVENIINETITDFYLTRQQVKLTKLMKEIRHRCRAAKLEPPKHVNTVKARLARVPAETQVRARRGDKAADDQFRPVTAEYHAEYALDVVQFDHTLVDVIVVDDVHRLPIQRPWLTLGIDIASRMVAGFYLTLEAPSALSICMALTHAVLPKEKWLADLGITAPWPVQGLMNKLHFDNGKEFHSEALMRGCREYRIEPVYRPPRTPHWGGHIERLIGTMMGEVHLLPGTTFSNIKEKGDYDAEANAVMTLGELETWFAIQVIAYQGSIHRSLQMPPSLAYADELAKRNEPPQQPRDPEQFFLDFLPFERRMIRRDGIQLFNIFYWDPVLSAWAGETKRLMVVKYDPRDLSQVYLHAPDGQYWPIPYRDLGRPRITLWEHRRARESLRARGIKAVDEKMLFDAVSAQRMLVAEAAAKTKAARRHAQRTAKALQATLPPPAPSEIPARDEPTDSPSADAGPRLPFKFEDWS